MSGPPDRQSTPAAPDGGDDSIRVMIVDDSLTVRTIFKRMVESDEDMTVSATASSAERAIAQLASTPIDVVLLDLEMPGMGGLEALPAILQTAQSAQVLVVSSLTEDGAEHTVSALSMGAADTMLKPRPGGFNDEYRSQLLEKIRALGTGNHASEADAEAETRAPGRTGAEANRDQASLTKAAGVASPKAVAIGAGKRPELIAIGASTGGIHALNIMLRALSPSFELPILITQHLPQSFIPVFARQIELACSRRAVIAEEGTEIRAGEVAIATGHGHMIIRRMGQRLVARTSAEPVHSGCLPSVDPMFESCAAATDGRMLAIVLSGMGRDGLEGAKAVADAGGTILAQDAETSAVWGMPGAVAKAGLASLVASPEALGAAVMNHARAVSAQALASQS